MARYKVAIKASAARELEAIPRKDSARVATRIRGLAREHRPPGVEKLSGDDKYRNRQGDYRSIYAVDDGEHTVTIVQRREVYRG